MEKVYPIYYVIYEWLHTSSTTSLIGEKYFSGSIFDKAKSWLIRLMLTKDSTRPFKAHGNALRGPVSIANNATEVKT